LQLARLASAQSSRQSFFAAAAAVASAQQPPSPGAGRHGSLMALMEGALVDGEGGAADRTKSGSGAAALLGKLGRNLGGGWGGGAGSRRASRRGASFDRGSDPGSQRSSGAYVEEGTGELRASSFPLACLPGGGSRVAPEDDRV
jgi:hypothetical protein